MSVKDASATTPKSLTCGAEVNGPPASPQIRRAYQLNVTPVFADHSLPVVEPPTLSMT